METLEFLRKAALVQAERGGLQGLTRILMEKTKKPVIIVDFNGKVMSWHSPLEMEISAEDYISLPSTIRNFKENPSKGILALGGRTYHSYAWPIGEGRYWGYLLVLVTDNELSKQISKAAEVISLVALVELNHQRELLEKEQAYRDEFVRDLLFNNFDKIEEIFKAGEIWGCNFLLSHIVLVLQPKFGGSGRTENISNLRTKIESYFSSKIVGSIVGLLGNFIVIIFPKDKQENTWKKRIRETYSGLAMEIPDWEFDAGVGKVYESVKMLYRSYQQAKVALELGKMVMSDSRLAFFEDLGAVRLFYNQNELDLNEYFEEVLGPLEHYDRDNGGSLLTTLWYYLAANRDSSLIAKKLFIHANTLRYRLRKIEELLEINLDDEQARFNIYAALQVAAILGKRELDNTKA